MSGYIIADDDKQYDIFYYGPFKEIEVRYKGNLVMSITYGHFYDFQFTSNFGGERKHFTASNHKDLDAMDYARKLINEYCS